MFGQNYHYLEFEGNGYEDMAEYYGIRRHLIKPVSSSFTPVSGSIDSVVEKLEPKKLDKFEALPKSYDTTH